jgi:hypothetical protein
MNNNDKKGRCALFLSAFSEASPLRKVLGTTAWGRTHSVPPHATFLRGPDYPWQVARQQSLRPFRRSTTVYEARRRGATCVVPAARHHHHMEAENE